MRGNNRALAPSSCPKRKTRRCCSMVAQRGRRSPFSGLVVLRLVQERLVRLKEHGLGAQSSAARHNTVTHLLYQSIQKCLPEGLQCLPKRRLIVIPVLRQRLSVAVRGLTLDTSRTCGASSVEGTAVSRSLSSLSNWATVGTAWSATSVSDQACDTRAAVAHHGIEIVSRRWIDRDAYAPGLGMHAKRCFQQVVHVFGHLHVKSRKSVRENDLILRTVSSA